MIDNKNTIENLVQPDHPNWVPPIIVPFNRFNTNEPATLHSICSPLTSVDLETITQICRSPLVYNILFVHLPFIVERSGPHPRYTVHDAQTWVNTVVSNWRATTAFAFAVRDQSDRIIAALDIKSPDLEEAEIGYWADPENPGYITNAVIALAQKAKSAGFKKLFDLIVPDNIRSIRVVTRAGFTSEGTVSKDKDYLKFSRILYQ